MRVFVTGATGFIGSALTAELIAHGHSVAGLARSDAAAETLRKAGATPHRGSVRDLHSLERGAAGADAVAHLAFTFSPPDLPLGRLLGAVFGGPPTQLVNRMTAAFAAMDRAAIDALGGALEGSGRPLVGAFALMGLAGAPGERRLEPAVESDEPDVRSPGYGRAANEASLHSWAARGVRTSVVRLAPSVHGARDKGLVPQIAAAARKHGESLYVDSGANRWCGVARADAATLFRLALEKGAAGGAYHAVGDDGLSFRRLAEILGSRLGLPTRSASLGEASRRLGWLAPFVALDNPAVSERTQSELGWRPSGPTLADDLENETVYRFT